MNRKISAMIACLLIGLATSASGQQNASQADQQASQEVHAQFTNAFNRQDSAALAALFTEDGIRVTPQGIIEGRAAIQADAEKRFQLRFHDLSITSQITRILGDSIWDVGEWTMRIGD